MTDRTPPFGGLWVEALGFKMVREAWTFAGRFQAAVMSDSLPQYHYYLTALEQVRGQGDNFVETQMYAVANAEARVIVFDSMWFAVMPAVFVDAAIARTMQGNPFVAVSAGAGFRFMIPRIYHSGLRLDFAWPVVPWGPRSLFDIVSIGVYQYF